MSYAINILTLIAYHDMMTNTIAIKSNFKQKTNQHFANLPLLKKPSH